VFPRVSGGKSGVFLKTPQQFAQKNLVSKNLDFSGKMQSTLFAFFRTFFEGVPSIA
jgi:hypothetical protein